MKKLLLPLFLCFCFPLFISLKAYAYTNNEVQVAIMNEFNSHFSMNITDSSNFSSSASNYNQNNNEMIMYKISNGTIFIYIGHFTNISENSFTVSGDYYVTLYSGGFSNYGGGGTYSESNCIDLKYYGNVNNFMNPVNYDNPIYSSSIPVPDMTVTYVGIGLTLPTNQNGVYVDCLVNESEAFYIQLQAKYSCADMVSVLLNDGVISYDYLNWSDGQTFDIYGLQDNAVSVHVTAQEFQNSWNDVINALANDSDFPQFTTNVPFWMSNPSAQKYVDAKNRYKNVLMRQAPMYGSRMELFARYYAISDNNIYVGRWVHWNSINPSNTEELSNQYQVDQPFPGYQNTSSEVNLPENDNTYNNMGETTSVNQNPYSQVIINNNVPNYPDYPTAVSYNHDNILLQFIDTAKQLPNFFGDFGGFLTASFTFIPSSIWALIGFGFMCSIVVMIIKVL